MDKLFIPNKINVGYQERHGTYTGKLAYVIYYDQKGVLRKEQSWQSWRDNKIPNTELTNEPTEGFVLNKGVGGTRESWGWNARNEYIRVYDPRDFEFEISVANLLFILQETSSIKGKGLEGEFVYAWSGTELVLLPVNCADYKKCKTHTERQSKKVTAKDMVAGCLYVMKDGTNVQYLGRHLYNSGYDYNTRLRFNCAGKRHIFLNTDQKDKYVIETGFTRVAEKITESPTLDYADNRDAFLKSENYGGIENLIIEESNEDIKTGYYDINIIKSGKGYKTVSYRKNYHNRHYWYTSKTNELDSLPTYTSNISAEFIPHINDNTIYGILFNTEIATKQISEEELKNTKHYNIYAVTTYGTKILVI